MGVRLGRRLHPYRNVHEIEVDGYVSGSFATSWEWRYTSVDSVLALLDRKLPVKGNWETIEFITTLLYLGMEV